MRRLAVAHPNFLRYATICQRDGSGIELHVGMPLPDFRSSAARKYRHPWLPSARARCASSAASRCPAHRRHGTWRSYPRKALLPPAIASALPGERIHPRDDNPPEPSSATSHPPAPCSSPARSRSPTARTPRRLPMLFPDVLIDFSDGRFAEFRTTPKTGTVRPRCSSSSQIAARRKPSDRSECSNCTVGPRYCDVCFQPESVRGAQPAVDFRAAPKNFRGRICSFLAAPSALSGRLAPIAYPNSHGSIHSDPFQ